MFPHNPADPYSLSHDIVYSLMVDHRGTMCAGTGDGLNRCEIRQAAAFAPGRASRPGDRRRKCLRWLRI